MRHRPQSLGVAPHIGLAQQQVRCQRQRGGAPHAGAYAAGGSQRVRVQHLVLVQQRQWPLRLGRVTAGGAGLQRQRGEVQGEPELSHLSVKPRQ